MLLHNKELLDRGRAVEKRHSGDRRKYDACLRVQGGYHAEKRVAMQELGYGQEDVEVGMNQPSPEAYHGEVQEHREHQKKFFRQLLLLASVDDDCLLG